ncbi:MAG: DUF4411 family protein [Candidatus Poribacteria bacterium]|nr:DUF4411 family protein [Candidatus Poribacteria bacterium]
MNEPHPLFLLDADALIGAHRRYYALDLCPGFWECLIHYCGENRVRSIDRVRDEILINSDRLSGWVKQAPTDLFVSSAEPSVTDSYVDMNHWVQTNPQFQPQAKEKFARVADGWVAAYAKVHNGVVVTQEVFSADVKKNVPLPNIFQQFGVNYCDTFEMLHTLDVRFEWEPP